MTLSPLPRLPCWEPPLAPPCACEVLGQVGDQGGWGTRSGILTSGGPRGPGQSCFCLKGDMGLPPTWRVHTPTRAEPSGPGATGLPCPHLKHLHGPGQRAGLGALQGEEQAQQGPPVLLLERHGLQGVPRLHGGCRSRSRSRCRLPLLAGVLDEALPPPDEARGLRRQGPCASPPLEPPPAPPQGPSQAAQRHGGTPLCPSPAGAGRTEAPSPGPARPPGGVARAAVPRRVETTAERGWEGIGACLAIGLPRDVCHLSPGLALTG